MPWEIATYLLGAQGGAEADFARLYEATNPILVRYLRVTADADGAELADLAIAAWTNALPQLMACPADEDAWLELVVDSARAAAAGSLRVGDGAVSETSVAGATGVGVAEVAPAEVAPAEVAAAEVAAAEVADADSVEHAIEALRACPPDEADVLAMGLVANLDRDATARLTDHEPAAVLALVQEGQEHLPMSLDQLTRALRSPGRAGEVADVGLVTPLITAALAGPAPTVEGHGEAGAGLLLAPVALIGTTAGAVASAGSAVGPAVGELSEPSLTALLGLESAAAVSGSVAPLAAFRSPAGTPSRSARVGIGAGVWLVALGGVGAAAAMTGLITATVDGLFGHNGPPLVTAEGPARPGTPSTTQPPAEPGQGTRPGSTGRPPTAKPPTIAKPPTVRGGSSQSVSLPGSSGTTEIVLASFVTPVTATPSTPANTPSTPTTPGTPGSPTTPSTPPVTQPSAGGPVVSGGNGHGAAQQARKATRQARAAARARAKAARLAAKASARAQHHGKALGHDKTKAQGKAVGHGNV